MRIAKQIVTDHELLLNIGADDHHNQGTFFTILINSQAIAGFTAYEFRYDLGKSGFKTLYGNLRGTPNVDIQGHCGCWFVAGDSSQECSGFSIRPYPSGTQSYIGGYSRLHGDSYLSNKVFGQDVIVLRDAYIDDDEAVLEFYNTYSSSRNLTVYGTIGVK
jgi:hypothetical protein